MVKGKRGWMRIMEAMVAILIIMGVVLIVIQKQQGTPPGDLSQNAIDIISEIALNQSLRSLILQYDFNDPASSTNAQTLNSLNNFVSTRIKDRNLKYLVRICDPLSESDSFCPLIPYPSDASEEIYTGERIISTDLPQKDYSPKKIKLFIWRVK